MLGPQNTCSPLLPFSAQPIRVPFVLARDCGEQGDRKWMELELFKDPVDESRSIVAVVDPVESIACSVHR